MKNPFSFYVCLFVLINYFILKTRGFSLVGAPIKTLLKDNTFSPTPNLANKNFFKKCDLCPKGAHCVPAIQCPAHVRMKGDAKPQVCDLPHGSHGLCCTTGRNHSATNIHLSKDTHARSAVDNKGNLTVAIQEARSKFMNLVSKEGKMRPVGKHQPEFMHNLVFRSSAESQMRSLDLQHKAMEQVLTSQIVKQREHISNEDFELGQVYRFYGGTPLENTCDQSIPCPPVKSKYHSQDGRCNHPDPEKASWGAAGSPMERLLPPSYHDSIWEPRHLSVDGTPLTNARTISRILLRDVERPHPTINLLFMQFGQFMTHDVTQSASIRTNDGRSVTCCADDGSHVLPPEQLHYSCWPIEVDRQDDFYSTFNQGCINFVRSSLSPDGQCRLGYGKQISKVTHTLDASVIYGSDLKTQAEVRAFEGGRLRMLLDFGREMLPLTMDQQSCVTMENGPCFFTGDFRANQVITLTAVHTLFAREHNRIAHILSQINPRWSDELLFYETRRIIIAKLQHIVYKEWIPLAIGSERLARFNLHIRDEGHSNDFNPEINSCITSEFSTAAMRFGHSTVDGKLLVHRGQQIDEIIDLPDVMFNPGRMRQPHFLDEIMLALERQPMQQADAIVTAGLSRYLFRGNNPFGLDLAAINIHRGRDHGIRPYNDYVEVSGYKRIQSFDEFGHEIASRLASVYHHPDDIDLWIGGLLESALPDAIVGPTFADIIADQFSKFRQGDNYFYEHGPGVNPGAFSPAQLREIKKTTLARLICDNSDQIQGQPPRALIRPDVPGNAPVSCSDSVAIPVLDYSPWREQFA